MKLPEVVGIPNSRMILTVGSFIASCIDRVKSRSKASVTERTEPRAESGRKPFGGELIDEVAPLRLLRVHQADPRKKETKQDRQTKRALIAIRPLQASKRFAARPQR